MRMYTLWSLGYAVRTVLILHAIPLRIEEAKSQKESRLSFVRARSASLTIGAARALRNS